MNEGKQFISTS